MTHNIDNNVGHKMDAPTKRKRSLRQCELINDFILHSNLEIFAMRCLSMQSHGSMKFNEELCRNWLRVATNFAAGIVKFCERLELGALAAILDRMPERLKAGMVAGVLKFSTKVNWALGARADLLSLAQVTFHQESHG